MKRKIVFALIMGVITTGVISFTLVSVNVGFTADFSAIWLRSWVLAYCIATPAILLFGPLVQQLVERLLPEKLPAENKEL